MTLDYTVIIVSLIGLLSTGGLWNYLQNKSKLNHDRQMNESTANLEFRESLKEQVTLLTVKVDKLISEKEELLGKLADIQIELAKANSTILHLEETLRYNRR
jgi:hypothetical protein